MDKALREQVLCAAVTDRRFLKQAWADLRAEDFSDKFESFIVRAAVDHWRKYEEPIGLLLSSTMDDVLERGKYSAESKKSARALCRTVQDAGQRRVSVAALIDRLKVLHTEGFYDRAVDEILDAQEKGALDAGVLQEIVERAGRELNGHHTISHNYMETLEDRIQRRANPDLDSYPLFLIDPLDERIRGIGKGHFGMVMAPPSGGKGLALVHLTGAYALQGLKVLHITLEDPRELVETRLDCSLTGLPLDRIAQLPNKLRKRFKSMKQQMHGSIRIVDCTEDDVTVTKIEQIYQQNCNDGFVADAVHVDYDDEIICEQQFKGESARRMEFAAIYRRLRALAKRTNTILWTAAQTGRDTEGRKIITSKGVAEDFSKIRKVFLCLAIGTDPEIEDSRYIYVAKHRLDRSRFAVELISDYGAAMFYDRERTIARRQALQMERAG